MVTTDGACLCGQVTWSVDMPADEGYILCHCNTCKTLSGGASTLNTILPGENLKMKSGTLKSYDYTGASGNPVHCYYCPNCTTHVYHHQTVMGPDKIVYRSGILPTGPSAKYEPKAEIFWKHAYPFEKPVADQSHVFDMAPPDA